MGLGVSISGEAMIVVHLAPGVDSFANLDTDDQFTNSRGFRQCP